MPTVDGIWFRVLERVYSLPEPPPRKRTKPLEVICVGMPRTGTESLQHALLQLGYDHTYHGWDIIFEEPNYAEQWVKLCRKKWYGSKDGDCEITAEEFDRVLGHAVALTDATGSVFAAELIRAYPEAKVVMNHRKDVDAWHRSVMGTIVGTFRNWPLFILSCLDQQCFWNWHLYARYMWPGLHRSLDGNVINGIAHCGKWAYREHYDMVRGMVPEDRRLEWCVEDGWEPLCKFLGKPVPEEPFPHANAAAGWAGQEAKVGKRFLKGAIKNVAIFVSIAAGIGAAVYVALQRGGGVSSV